MKNPHELTFIACFLLALNTVFAQDSLQKKHLILKIAPLTLFDIDNTFQLATEHSLSKNNRWTLSEELGYGQGKANIWGETNTYGPYREHYRAKLEARKYGKKISDMTGTYVAYELFYKQVNDHLNRSIGRECESGPCNYYENLDYPVSKYVVGTTIKIGYQARFRDEDKKNTKFVFDFYVGLGIRKVMIDHKVDLTLDNSSGAFYGNNFSFGFGSFGYKDRTYNVPHVAFGIRLGYTIF